MKDTVNFFIVFLALSVSTITKAENQEMHFHGLATLTLALEGEVLEIQFESPAINLIGFEHSARSPKERRVVKKTVSMLKSPKIFFMFVGTSCQLKETIVDVSGVMEGNSSQYHRDYNHSKDDSDDSHSEIVASYRFICKDTKKLNAISIALFDQFPRIEKINAMWVTDSQQGSNLLSPSSNTLSLR